MKNSSNNSIKPAEEERIKQEHKKVNEREKKLWMKNRKTEKIS